MDCWSGKDSYGSYKPPASSGAGPPTHIICYLCGEAGHKSRQCRKGVKVEKAVPGDVKPKPVRREWSNKPTDIQLIGKVNAKEVPILLDSGASISVVSLWTVPWMSSNKLLKK